MAYLRGEPHEYIVHYVGGRIKRQGQGLAFWYFPFNSSISIIPLNVSDVPFAFQDVTADFQTVTYQGQASFRIVDTEAALARLNLAVRPRTKEPLGQDLDLLSQRVANAVNSSASTEIQSRVLKDCLRNFELISQAVLARVRADAAITSYGIELVSLVITSIRPTPEVSKALEAEFREGLLRRADEAIYARRTAAIQEERKIKETELETDLSLETRRRDLIALASENQILEADARGKALVTEGKYRLEQLQAETAIWQSLDPAVLAAQGMRELGEKGADHVTITTEVLSAMLKQSNAR